MVTIEEKPPEKKYYCPICNDLSLPEKEMREHLKSFHKYDEGRANALFLAQAAGVDAVPIPDDFKKVKDITDVLGDGKIKFFNELPRITWDKLVDQRFIIQAIHIQRQFNSLFGKSDFPLFKVLCEDGKIYTTLGSGKAVFNQAEQLVNKKHLPVKVRLIWQEGEGGGQPYYLMVQADKKLD